jgi:high-affinity iron transporter
MQELGWIPFGTAILWNTTHFLSEDSTLGDILHTFLGYAETPTILQGAIYAAYLLIVGTIFVRMTRKPSLPILAQANETKQNSVTSGTLHSRA